MNSSHPIALLMLDVRMIFNKKDIFHTCPLYTVWREKLIAYCMPAVSFIGVKVYFSHTQASEVWGLTLEFLIDRRHHQSFIPVFCESQTERNASVKDSTLSYCASGFVGCVLTIWVTSQWNLLFFFFFLSFLFFSKKLNVVFSDQ